MIEIILEDGTSLALKKDWEFEITLEQPMLDDSHIPIPYSTRIALPYTEPNRLARSRAVFTPILGMPMA